MGVKHLWFPFITKAGSHTRYIIDDQCGLVLGRHYDVNVVPDTLPTQFGHRQFHEGNMLLCNLLNRKIRLSNDYKKISHILSLVNNGYKMKGILLSFCTVVSAISICWPVMKYYCTSQWGVQ